MILIRDSIGKGKTTIAGNGQIVPPSITQLLRCIRRKIMALRVVGRNLFCILHQCHTAVSAVSSRATAGCDRTRAQRIVVCNAYCAPAARGGHILGKCAGACCWPSVGIPRTVCHLPNSRCG